MLLYGLSNDEKETEVEGEARRTRELDATDLKSAAEELRSLSSPGAY